MHRLTSRLSFILILAASTALVGGGLYLATALRLAACPLCIIQRMLYMALAFVALAALCLPRCRLAQIPAALFSMAIAGLGAFVAGYQVWLQRFAPNVSCTAAEPWWESFVYWAGEKLPVLFKASGLCSDPAWKFLSLSIADWSLLCFLALTALGAWALVRICYKE